MFQPSFCPQVSFLCLNLKPTAVLSFVLLSVNTNLNIFLFLKPSFIINKIQDVKKVWDAPNNIREQINL